MFKLDVGEMMDLILAIYAKDVLYLGGVNSPKYKLFGGIMKYNICENIRVRLFKDKVYFINIETNDIHMIGKVAFDYLNHNINESIKDDELSQFAYELNRKGILDIYNDY